MKKRLITLLLAAALIVGLLPVSAMALENGFEVVISQHGEELQRALTNTSIWTGTIKVALRDKDEKSKPLPGADIVLYEWDGEKYVPKESLTDQGNGSYTGKASYDQTNKGKFKLVQEKTPEGYYHCYADGAHDKNGTTMEFVVNSRNMVISYEMENRLNKTTITVSNLTEQAAGGQVGFTQTSAGTVSSDTESTVRFLPEEGWTVDSGSVKVTVDGEQAEIQENRILLSDAEIGRLTIDADGKLIGLSVDKDAIPDKQAETDVQVSVAFIQIYQIRLMEGDTVVAEALGIPEGSTVAEELLKEAEEKLITGKLVGWQEADSFITGSTVVDRNITAQALVRSNVGIKDGEVIGANDFIYYSRDNLLEDQAAVELAGAAAVNGEQPVSVEADDGSLNKLNEALEKEESTTQDFDFISQNGAKVTVKATLVKTYTVSFDVNGGKPAPGTQIINKGEAAMEPKQPEREGYDFTGWFLNGEKYDFNTAVEQDIVLKAGWLWIRPEPSDTPEPSAPQSSETPAETQKPVPRPSGEPQATPQQSESQEPIVLPAESAQPSKATENTEETPKTGDDSQMLLWVAAIAASLLILSMVVWQIRKKRKG